MDLGFEPARQELADAILAETDALAVEVLEIASARIGRAGEIPTSEPIRIIPLEAGGRVYGSLALWSTGVLDESTINDIRFVANVASSVLERDSLRRETDQFIRSLTHDLRAILVRTSNMAQLLGKTDHSTGDTPELLRYLTDNLAAGDSLLRQVAEYASAGRSDEPRRELSVTTIAEAVRWNVKPLLLGRGASLLIEEGDLTVAGRERELIDVLQRVVDNSIKFGASEIIVRSSHSDGGVLISVDDDGPGIEPEYFEKVFEPFQRLHGSGIPGHGLGLPIARKIIELHGGRIWLEALPNRGTGVRTWLPGSFDPTC
jgi:signal transduction histidine kinase